MDRCWLQILKGEVMVMRGSDVEIVLWPGSLVGDAELLLGKLDSNS